MKQYKVIALSVGGRANKIFSAGDTVNEDNFIPGRADELVRKGFLQFIGDTECEASPMHAEEIEVEFVKVEKEEDEEGNKSESSLLENIKNSLGGTDKTDESAIDAISKNQLKKSLTELGVPFEPTASKKELYDLWISRDNY